MPSIIVFVLLLLFPVLGIASPLIQDESLVLSLEMSDLSGNLVLNQNGAPHARILGSSYLDEDGAICFPDDDAKIASRPLYISSTALSATAVFKINSETLAQDDARILGQGLGVAEQDQEIMLSLSNGLLRGRIKISGNTVTLVGNIPVPLNTEVHAALTFDGSTVKLLQDAQVVASMAVAGSINFASSPLLFIGDQPFSGDYHMNLKGGAVKRVSFYNRALTLSEIEIDAGMAEPAVCGDNVVEGDEECEGSQSSQTVISCVIGNYPGEQTLTSTCNPQTCTFGNVVAGSCETDLFCGDNICTPGAENDATCPADCEVSSGGGDIPVLVPGNGSFSSPNLGNIGGSSLETVARFDVTPFAEFSDEYYVGLPAFHKNGINRVEFSVDGGPWTSVTAMVENPGTCSSQDMSPVAQCVTEYTAKVRAADFAQSKQIEIRAVAYPNAGKPRLLSVKLNVDKGDLPHRVKYVSPSGTNSSSCGASSSPCYTITQALNNIQSEQGSLDGATVYLTAGTHQLTTMTFTTNNRLVRIAAAPGVSRSSVILSGSNPSLNISKLKFENVTWRINGAATTSPAYAGHVLELNKVHMLGDGQHVGSGPGSYPWLSPSFPWDGGASLIDCLVSDAKFGPTMSYLARNTRVERIGEDVFRYPTALINVVVDTVHPGSTGWHSDLIEISGGYTLENALFYGLHATDINAQAIFTKAAGTALTQFKNSAIVNSVFHKTDSAWVAQFDDNSSVDNVIFLNNTFANFSLLFLTPLINNIHAEGNIFAKVGGTVQDSWFKNNHYISYNGFGDLTPGTNYTVGAVQFNNAGNADFSLSPSSTLKDSIPSVVASDVAGQQRGPLSSKGAFE
ncbi:MAG: LamG domain-containing protein [Deltaproteobacteria bacterium]|nr:LamG domain-containing protein [Deltaproteobacteria bacterium]